MVELIFRHKTTINESYIEENLTNIQSNQKPKLSNGINCLFDKSAGY